MSTNNSRRVKILNWWDKLIQTENNYFVSFRLEFLKGGASISPQPYPHFSIHTSEREWVQIRKLISRIDIRRTWVQLFYHISNPNKKLVGRRNRFIFENLQWRNLEHRFLSSQTIFEHRLLLNSILCYNIFLALVRRYFQRNFEIKYKNNKGELLIVAIT